MILLFALGLAAKPMVISLPLLLLLWDFWPLHAGTAPSRPSDQANPVKLVIEKIPLFVLSAASVGITIFAQLNGSALGTTDYLLPLGCVLIMLLVLCGYRVMNYT